MPQEGYWVLLMATRNPARQPCWEWLVVEIYHFFLQGLIFYIPGGWPWDFWTINSMESFVILEIFLVPPTKGLCQHKMPNGKHVALQMQSWDILLSKKMYITCRGPRPEQDSIHRCDDLTHIIILNEIGLRMLPNFWRNNLSGLESRTHLSFVKMTLKNWSNLLCLFALPPSITNLISNSRFNGYRTVGFQNPKWLKSEYHEFRNSFPNYDRKMPAILN